MKKLIIWMLSYSLLFSKNFDFEYYEKKQRLVDSIYSYLWEFILILLTLLIIKNIIDLIFKFKNRTIKIKEHPIFDFNSNSIEDYKDLTTSSILSFFKKNFNNSFEPKISNVNSEILEFSLTSINHLSYNFQTSTYYGSDYSLPEVSLEVLDEIAHKEGNDFIINKNNILLLKNYLDVSDFGQHLPVFKSFSANGVYNHDCYNCYGSGSESCTYCHGSGSYYVTKTEWKTNHKGDSYVEDYQELESCSYCYGSGSVTCGSCEGYGYQHDINVVNIIVISEYQIQQISNNDLKLKEIIEKTLLPEIVNISVTLEKVLNIYDSSVKGFSSFKTPYAVSNIFVENKDYDIKTLGIKNDVIDISKLAEDILKEEINTLSDNKLNFLNFMNIRKQENYLKNLFKYKNNIEILSEYLKIKSNKKKNIENNNYINIKTKYSLNDETIENMINKTRKILINLRKFSIISGFVLSLIFTVVFTIVSFINTGNIFFCFLYFIFTYLFFFVLTLGYYYLKINIIAEKVLSDFTKKEGLYDLEKSFIFWKNF
jgi:hypothetical protein